MIEFPAFWKQLLVCLGPYILTIGMSSVLGYSSILIPQLHFRSSNVFTTQPEEISWIASISALPLAIGSLLGGYLMEKIGRKWALQIASLPAMVGWIIIGLSYNVPMLMVGRFHTGISAGMKSPVANVYVGEISQANHRALLLALNNSMVTFGILLCHTLGTYLTWNVTAFIILVIELVGSMVVMFVSPESPIWLIKDGEVEKSARVFQRLRNKEMAEIEEEFNSIKEKVQSHDQEVKDFWYYVHCLSRPEFYKPLLILIVFFVTVQLSGLSTVTYYSVTLLGDVLGPSFDSHIAMLIIDIIRALWSSMSILLMQLFTRRRLTMISGFGTSFCLTYLCTFSYLSREYEDLEEYPGILIAGLVFYMSFMCIGLIPLPWCMLGELFSVQTKGFGASIAASTSYMFSFVVVKMVPYMIMTIGSPGIFLIYSIGSLLGTIFLTIFLPETKNKSLSEIEDHFKKKEDTPQDN